LAAANWSTFLSLSAELLPVQLNVRILAIGPGVNNPCESQVWYLIAMIRSHNVGEDFNIL
jgi:hypothetical protein